MAKEIWPTVSEWLGGNPITATAAVQGSNNRRTLIWETDAHNGVAVIEKVGDERRGHFVGVRIEQKPFKTVVANVKRAYTLEKKKSEAALC